MSGDTAAEHRSCGSGEWPGRQGGGGKSRDEGATKRGATWAQRRAALSGVATPNLSGNSDEQRSVDRGRYAVESGRPKWPRSSHGLSPISALRRPASSPDARTCPRIMIGEIDEVVRRAILAEARPSWLSPSSPRRSCVRNRRDEFLRSISGQEYASAALGPRRSLDLSFSPLGPSPAMGRTGCPTAAS
ncbi:hypothetical protein KM043_012324 [Ampulex compressa]|nr:hypothetical protein KM043_012324 [Ampulex compressa]